MNSAYSISGWSFGVTVNVQHTYDDETFRSFYTIILQYQSIQQNRSSRSDFELIHYAVFTYSLSLLNFNVILDRVSQGRLYKTRRAASTKVGISPPGARTELFKASEHPHAKTRLRALLNNLHNRHVHVGANREVVGMSTCLKGLIDCFTLKAGKAFSRF
jgi:hypothetical protein